MRLCLWQQSKETVNPALQLLPPAESAAEHLLQNTGLVSAHSACSHLFKKNGDGLTRTWRLYVGLEVACPQSENTKSVEIPMNCTYSHNRRKCSCVPRPDLDQILLS